MDFNYKKTTDYEPINSSSKTLEEIKKILVSKKNTDSSCISVYDVAKLFKMKFDDFENHREYWSNLILDELEVIIFNLDNVFIEYHDKKPKEIKINFFTPEPKTVVFSKEKGDLYIKESELYENDTKKLLKLIGNIVLEMFDDFKNLDIKSTYYDKFAKSVNANFYINFALNQVEIYNKDFSLKYSNFSEDYEYECNSNKLLNVISGYEDELFKNIFVNIDDCPEWSKPFLYEIRQKQLNPSFFARIKNSIINSSNSIKNNLKQK